MTLTTGRAPEEGRFDRKLQRGGWPRGRLEGRREGEQGLRHPRQDQGGRGREVGQQLRPLQRLPEKWQRGWSTGTRVVVISTADGV
jgi:hypothetical protein